MNAPTDHLSAIFKCAYQALISNPPFQHLLQLRPHLTIGYKDSYIDDVDTPEQATVLVSHYCELVDEELNKQEPSTEAIQELLINRAEPLARLANNMISIDRVANLLATIPEQVAGNNLNNKLWSECTISIFLLVEDYKYQSTTKPVLKVLERYLKYIYSRKEVTRQRLNAQAIIRNTTKIEATLPTLKAGQDKGLLAFTYCKLGNEYFELYRYSPEKTLWLKKSRDAFKKALIITKYGKGPAAWAWPNMFLLKLRAQLALRPSHLKVQIFGPIDSLRLFQAKQLLIQNTEYFGPSKMMTLNKVLEGESSWIFSPTPDSDGGHILEMFSRSRVSIRR